MTSPTLYALAAAALFGVGLYGLVIAAHVMRKLLALNVMGSGVFLLFVTLSSAGGDADPVPVAMVLTGIVIAVSATAFALALLVRMHRETGSTSLDDGSG